MNIEQTFQELFSGTLLTLELMLFSLLIGLSLALLFTVLVEMERPILKPFINGFIFIMRGTPLLVQIFIIYYGSGQFTWLRETFLWDVLKHPFGCAVTALALNTSAYTTVLLRGAIRSIPQGEIEACYALGLSRWQMLHRIIIPRAFRIALPAYSNEVIMILKSTSLASTVTLMDLTGVTQYLIAVTYDTIPLFLMAGGIYLLLNGLLIGGFKVTEKKLLYLKR